MSPRQPVLLDTDYVVGMVGVERHAPFATLLPFRPFV